MKAFLDGDTLFITPDNFVNLQESPAFPATVKELAKALALAVSLNIEQGPDLDSWFSYHIEVNPEDFTGQPAPFAGPVNVIISPRDDLMQPPVNIYNTTHVTIDEKVIQKIVSSVILELRVMGQADERKYNRRGGNHRPARFRE